MPDNNESHFSKTALLERVMGDEELARNIVAVFLQDVPERIKQLEDSLAKNDSDGVAKTAHAIKGVAANVGANALSELARVIEGAAASNDMNSVAGKITRLDSEFEELKREMEMFIE